jgi:hypothetical protein
MNIKLDRINDPRLRARIEQALEMGSAPAVRQASVRPGMPIAASEAPRPLRRIQQAINPKLNKLEQAALAYLKVDFGTAYDFRPHAIRMQLANGCNYTPDIIGQPISPYNPDSRLRAWEVKGKYVWDDSIVKLKVAAHEWPSIKFTLIWREGKFGAWQQQEVLA